MTTPVFEARENLNEFGFSQPNSLMLYSFEPHESGGHFYSERKFDTNPSVRMNITYLKRPLLEDDLHLPLEELKAGWATGSTYNEVNISEVINTLRTNDIASEDVPKGFFNVAIKRYLTNISREVEDFLEGAGLSSSQYTAEMLHKDLHADDEEAIVPFKSMLENEPFIKNYVNTEIKNTIAYLKEHDEEFEGHEYFFSSIISQADNRFYTFEQVSQEQDNTHARKMDHISSLRETLENKLKERQEQEQQNKIEQAMSGLKKSIG